MLSERLNLHNKIAIVTGAGRGIGRSIALAFAGAGADVVAVSRTASQVNDTAARVVGLGRKALAIPTDVTDEDQVDSLIEKTVSEFGRIDILVNDAGTDLVSPLVAMPGVKIPGIGDVGPESFTRTSLQDWRRTIDTNLTSIFLCCRAVGPHMIKQKKGKIINITSTMAKIGNAYRTAYTSSKAAVAMFTRSLALEWARYNINVNALGPGTVRTDMIKWILEDEQALKGYINYIPLRRLGETEDIAIAAIYLASEASDYMTGESIYVGGGIGAA